MIELSSCHDLDLSGGHVEFALCSRRVSGEGKGVGSRARRRDRVGLRAVVMEEFVRSCLACVSGSGRYRKANEYFYRLVRLKPHWQRKQRNTTSKKMQA
jgi:hypothetical protein